MSGSNPVPAMSMPKLSILSSLFAVEFHFFSAAWSGVVELRTDYYRHDGVRITSGPQSFLRHRI